MPFSICWPIRSVENDTESLSISGTIATKLFPTSSSNTASRVSIDSKSSSCVTGEREISIIFPRTSTTAGSKEGAVDGTLLGGSLCVTVGGEEGTSVGKWLGSQLGMVDGSADGDGDGMSLGNTDGALEGSFEGSKDGL